MKSTVETRRVFFIDSQLREQPAGDARAMGFKALNLARMAEIGLPVPEAFVLGTGFCLEQAREQSGAQKELAGHLAASIRRLESSCGLVYGGSRKPMLVSVRSGAPVSMPGMMATILNVGLNETTLRGLLRMTGNPRLPWDSYRRFVQSFAEVVDRCPAQPFEALLAESLDRHGATRPQELDANALSQLARDYLALYKKLTRRAFPQDPQEQLQQAVRGVFQSWHDPRAREYRRLHGLDDDAGTAVTVQRMVFGNAGGTSGSGVAFTRDPSSGENRLYMDFAFNAQGEDIVSGRHSIVDYGQLGAIFPSIERQIGEIARALESQFGDMQEFEFTVQDETLHLLQTRTGQRTPFAALRIAVEQVRDGLLEPGAALARLSGIDLTKIERLRVEAGADCRVLGRATPASLGVAIGAIALDAEKAKDMAAHGPVILVRNEIATSDIGGLAAAKGLLTALGGRTSHAAVVARQMDKVCLVGCAGLAIDTARRTCAIGDTDLKEGEMLCLDANTGRVIAGAPEIVRERPEPYLAEVEKWRAAAGGRRASGSQRTPESPPSTLMQQPVT
jgi:pyruvate,orthophosphate dikinase